ncbi:ATP-binding cassette domain-containing protein [Elioraea rosea]|uniref:ATP-binding cassette domain-containing protein n=1 Tax=Elioraea rosea TaxID=2492390 RepID=UPI0011837916|nr:ABC transporter ATP-binding protein [Elioraea rosea]
MIAFENVHVRFGTAEALSGITMMIEAGELCALVGPSGSGKTTLLRLVNRLVAPSRGRVFVRGEDVARLDPAKLRQSIGYAMQSVGLFPHRTVAENIATVPRLRGWNAPRIAARTAELMALLHLDRSLAGRLPRALSGGQAQRVGLARALAADPDILLMDEPFGAVDPITRRELRTELRRIHQATGKTIVLVTHDPDEALELGTQLVVLRGGRVVAAGPAASLIAPGADAFARQLLGGTQPGLRRFALLPAAASVVPEAPPQGAPELPAEASLADALSLMAESGATVLACAGGSLHAEAVLRQA